MKVLKLVLFITGTIIVSSQTFNHVFVKVIEPRFSILDNYKDSYEKDISGNETLKELEKKYKAVFDSMDEIKNKNQHYRDSDEFKELELQKNELRKMIEETESVGIEKKKLVFYWFFGLLSVLIGILVYVRFNPWIGLSGIITGFAEMITWTSPLYHTHISGFYEVITMKLVFSLLTLFILIASWILNNKYSDKIDRKARL